MTNFKRDQKDIVIRSLHLIIKSVEKRSHFINSLILKIIMMCCVCVYVYYLMDNLDFKLSSFVLKFIFLLSNYLVYYIHIYLWENVFWEKFFENTQTFVCFDTIACSASLLLSHYCEITIYKIISAFTWRVYNVSRVSRFTFAIESLPRLIGLPGGLTAVLNRPLKSVSNIEQEVNVSVGE